MSARMVVVEVGLKEEEVIAAAWNSGLAHFNDAPNIAAALTIRAFVLSNSSIAKNKAPNGADVYP